MVTPVQDQDRQVKQALVVGGQHGFVKEKLSKNLARHGIGIHTHWSWEKKRPPQVFPQGIDLVYICTDMVGHGLSVPCMNWARDQGLPYINGTRKWAESILRLTQGGFPLVDPVTSVPEIIAEVRASRSPAEMARGPSEDEMFGLAVALTGDIEAAGALVTDYDELTGHVNTRISPPSTSITAAAALPALDQETPHMSIIGQNSHLAVTNPKQREYLRALAFSPDVDNGDLWDKVSSLPMFAGNKFDPERASHARKSLGITIVRKGGYRTVNVNTVVFASTLKLAKIEGCPAPREHYTTHDNAFQRVGKTEPASVAETAAPPPAAPVVAAVPAAPVVSAPIPPVVAATVSNQRWPNDDFKTLLSLMREHMAVHNLKSLTITETGVSFKRIEVVEGDLAL